MKDLATKKLLAGEDVDRLASVLGNLLEEVVTLSERIAALEGRQDADMAQERINDLVDRVLAPLA